MPRPDLTALGVGYRRIPVVAIGRDIYHDTRLVLRKLEVLFPGMFLFVCICVFVCLCTSSPPITITSPKTIKNKE